MAWEELINRIAYCGLTRGKEWLERPCVRIGKTRLTFNKQFVDVFAKGSLKGLYLLFDEDRRAIGFKVPSKDQIERDAGWYTVGTDTYVRKSPVASCAGYMNGCDRILSRITDCIGKTYRAELNPKDRIIEVVLSPENQAR